MKFLKLFVIVIVAVLLIKTFIFSSCTIPSSGMENSLFRGDRVIVNKWSYGFRIPFMSLFSYHRLAQKSVSKGDVVVFNNPFPIEDEAVDYKDVYISRCVGLPGDTLMLDSQLLLTVDQVFSPDSKTLYSYSSKKEDTLIQTLKRLQIENNELIGCNDEGFVRGFSHYEVYLIRQELGDALILKDLRAQNQGRSLPFVIPKKGIAVRVYPWNVKLLRNTIVCHEGKSAEIKNGTLIVEGQRIYSYIFDKDYYWMASNNSVNLSDSRLFGLVPEDHLIGKASFVWFSKDCKESFWGGYRWNRCFQFIK